MISERIRTSIETAGLSGATLRTIQYVWGSSAWRRIAIWAQGGSSEAEALLREALESGIKVLGDDRYWTTESIRGLAQAERRQRKFRTAGRLFSEAAAIRRR